MMREAYPGAVYYHMATPYRVWRIKLREHQIMARPEKRYTTRPVFLPALIFPNLTAGSVYGLVRYGQLVVAESNLQIKERISGFRERRGPTEFSITYPLDSDIGYFFDQPHFTRNYFSSGVIFKHPLFNTEQCERDLMSELLFEAFLMQIPFERQDISYGADSIRADREPFQKGERFVCIYDQTYGSLRLTNRLMDSEVLRGTFEKALDIACHDSRFQLNSASMGALKTIVADLESEPEFQVADGEEIVDHSGNLVPIIMPGSIGLSLEHNNEEFRIEDVFNAPSGLRYRGRRSSQESRQFNNVVITMPVDAIVAVPDVSQLGFYNVETGEKIPASSGSTSENNNFEILTFE
jgi:DEAD/DEAH box helicase domain-containing protein